jgi:AcrR family transcriptional regulator
MPTAKVKPADLKEACVQAAREVIAEHGVEGLSMRDVARKLGISHQAPYRHFASRDHLLAEIMRRCFADFARHLDQRPPGSDPHADLEGMGQAYLSYAEHKPLEYRLMFGTPWPEPAQHPDLVKHAVHAFDILRDSLRRMYGDTPGRRAQADLDALFIWSTLHGMASIKQANVMQHLALEPDVMGRFKADLMAKIGVALAGGDANPGTSEEAKR